MPVQLAPEEPKLEPTCESAADDGAAHVLSMLAAGWGERDASAASEKKMRPTDALKQLAEAVPDAKAQ